jgi:hypothetical protein
MSVYEQAYATPSRILGVYRYLLHAKRQRAARSELEALLMPENLPLKDGQTASGSTDEEPEERKGAPKREMVQRTIDEAITMRLAASDGDDVLLHPDLPAAARSPESGEQVARRTLSSLLLSTENAANGDLAKVLAWYLGQDVYAAPSNWADVEQQHSEEKKALEMTNSRFGQLVHWSRFLGFAWAHAAPEKAGQRASRLALTPDPYWQLRWRLADLFAEQRSAVLPLAAVVGDLAVAVPVLEGGTFRNALEGRLLPAREPHQLSSSSAHAWLRLHEDGIVRLAYRSDGKAYVFPLGDGEERFTEVTWQGGGSRHGVP